MNSSENNSNEKIHSDDENEKSFSKNSPDLREELLKSRKSYQSFTQDATFEETQFIVFRVKEFWYAIESIYISEVIRMGHISPFPLMPEYYLGVMANRGEILPVLDIAILLNTANESTENLFNISQRAIVISYNKMSAILSTEYLKGVTFCSNPNQLSQEQIDIKVREICSSAFVENSEIIHVIEVDKLLEKTKCKAS